MSTQGQRALLLRDSVPEFERRVNAMLAGLYAFQAAQARGSTSGWYRATWGSCISGSAADSEKPSYSSRGWRHARAMASIASSRCSVKHHYARVSGRAEETN